MNLGGTSSTLAAPNPGTRSPTASASHQCKDGKEGAAQTFFTGAQSDVPVAENEPVVADAYRPDATISVEKPACEHALELDSIELNKNNLDCESTIYTARSASKVGDKGNASLDPSSDHHVGSISRNQLQPTLKASKWVHESTSALLGAADRSGNVNTETTLPAWLQARPDFHRLATAALELEDGCASSSTLFAQHPALSEELTGDVAVVRSSGVVFVQRALETPPLARGAKDIQVSDFRALRSQYDCFYCIPMFSTQLLCGWLGRQELFSHLGPLQLASVARSVTLERLPAGAKMSPMSESAYLVLSGYLQIERPDKSSELVCPGQSLGPRTWWVPPR